MHTRILAIAWAIAAILVLPAAPAGAHLHDHVGGVNITVGWAEEPAFAGQPNAVEVVLTEGGAGDHEHGAGEETPVDPKQVGLKVEIIFGDRAGTEKLDPVALTPFRFGGSGEFRTASIVPTRPGTYTFHISGKLKGRAFDKFYTSGEKGKIEGTQFNDVNDVQTVSFPAKDPSNRELADSVQRLQQEMSASRVAARKAADDTGFARTVGFGGVAIGVIALALALLFRLRKSN